MAWNKSNSRRFDGIGHDCHGCVLGQARAASVLAGLTNEQEEKVVSVAEKWLADAHPDTAW